MAVTTAAIIGAGTAAYGAYSSNRNARAAQSAQERAMANATTSLGAFRIGGGANGTGAQMGWTPYNDGSGRYFGDFRLSGGALDPVSAALSQYAGQGVPSFSNSLPANVQQALQGFQGSQGIPDLDMAGLDQLLGGANSAFTQAQQGLRSAGQIGGFDPAALFGQGQNLFGQGQNLFGQGQNLASMLPGSNQFQTGLQGTAFGNAQALLGNLGQTYDQAYGNTLGTLRAQAQPEEARAFAGLTDNLFATGRLGSTGGGLQTEAFARGLGQADLSRQLAATQQAQQAQQNQLGLAVGQTGIGTGLAAQGNNNMAALSSTMQGLFGAGSNMFGVGGNLMGMGLQGTSLQDQLLNSAFGRFGQTSQLAADLNQARFARSMYGNETMYNRSQNMLGTQINLAGLPASLQAAQLGNVNAALQGQSGIQSQLLQMFGAGLSAEQAAANARVGAGSNMAQIVGSPSFGAAGQANAAMWSQLGSSLMNQQNGMGGLLGRIFGGSGGEQIQSPDAWGALDDALASGQVGG
jgi:hypothetical protein